MGWAVCTRATGRLTAWDRNAPDTPIDPVMEVRVQTGDTPPEFHTVRWNGTTGLRPSTAQEVADDEDVAQSERERLAFDGLAMLKAVVLWQAQLHGMTPAQARQQILTIYRAL